MSTTMEPVPETASEAPLPSLAEFITYMKTVVLAPEADEIDQESEDLIELDTPEDPQKPIEDHGNSVSPSNSNDSDQETLVGEVEADETEPIKEVRLRGGFCPITRPRKLNQTGSLLLAGHVDDKQVIHVVTRVEQFLRQSEKRAGTGTRFVPQEPDKLHLVLETKGPESEDLALVDESPKFLPPFNVKRKDGVQYHYEEYFQIRESPMGGLGCFAVKDLKKDDLILMETPILKTNSFSLYKDLRALDKESQEIYMNLAAIEAEGLDKIERIKRANAFQIPSGIAIMGIGSRFNHGCGWKRNVRYTYDPRRNVMSFEVIADQVLAGEELLVTYGGSPTNLYRSYGFRCRCGGCRGVSDDEVKKIKDEEYGSW